VKKRHRVLCATTIPHKVEYDNHTFKAYHLENPEKGEVKIPGLLLPSKLLQMSRERSLRGEISDGSAWYPFA
jgi:hypothetical protein